MILACALLLSCQEYKADLQIRVRTTPQQSAELRANIINLSKEVPDVAQGRKFCLRKGIFVGPNLWSIPDIKKLKGSRRIKMAIPNQGDPKNPSWKEMGLIPRASIQDLINEVRPFFVVVEPSKIRPLSKNELTYIWAIINWDIDGAILALETTRVVMVFNSDKNGQLFYIEALPLANDRKPRPKSTLKKD